jgi:hypothetical protein
MRLGLAKHSILIEPTFMSDLPTFDDYWKSLIDRVYKQHQQLEGQEALFYRLSCIYGETMVDGIEAYFERRFKEFDADMRALESIGFADVASDFDQARQRMFGDVPLEQSTVEEAIDKFSAWEEADEEHPAIIQLGEIYRRLIPRLEELDEHKFKLGAGEGFYRFEEPETQVAPAPVERKPAPPCPQCGKPLRSELAKQCFECGADWH